MNSIELIHAELAKGPSVDVLTDVKHNFGREGRPISLKSPTDRHNISLPVLINAWLSAPAAGLGKRGEGGFAKKRIAVGRKKELVKYTFIIPTDCEYRVSLFVRQLF